MSSLARGAWAKVAVDTLSLQGWTSEPEERQGRPDRENCPQVCSARGEAAESLECSSGVDLVCGLSSAYKTSSAVHVGLTAPFPVNPEP